MSGDYLLYFEIFRRGPNLKLLFFFLLILFCGISSAQSRYYFYQRRNFGSEALYNPVYVILNGSFDIIQLEGHQRDIFNFPYAVSIKNVMRNLGNPFPVIKRYGWGKFLANEIFPIDFAKKGAQWWPNYQLHLIGGGMTFVALKEWYEQHNFPDPEIFSLATVATYHLLNEFVENGSYVGDNEDPIPDIYVFDIGGIVLFSFDGIDKFFSRELNLADWSLQPSFSFIDKTLQNNGQYFSIKWKLPFSDAWHLFYYFGMNGLTGLSYKFKDGKAISFGLGLRAKNLVTVNQSVGQKTIDMTWNAGLFYDIDNSLMSSLFVSGLTDYHIDLNIYPGIFKIGPVSPGVWVVIQRSGKMMFGFTTVWAPGLVL